jgi:GntR family transcriptional regulator, transcriptional repressor for pyruvate dehydrogenase complex
MMASAKPQSEMFANLALRARSGSLVQLVTDQIETMIRARRLVEGDQLPPERELCRQFGVSRTVVREAVAWLSAKNLVEVRGGASGGIVVRGPTAEQVSDSLSLLLSHDHDPSQQAKVLEVRRLLEVEIAALAAERRTDADLHKLEAILAEHEDVRDDRERYAQLDLDFHVVIAGATQNELFVILLDALRGISLSMRRLGYSTPGNPQRAQRYHRAILEQIRAGSVKGAREAMLAHLIEAEETMQLALVLMAEEQPASAPEGGYLV